MKKSDPLSQAVIMCGISGSGKTHFARQLEKAGYIRVSTDALIWEQVGPRLFNLPKDEQRRLFSECREKVSDQLVSLLKEGKKVVVDATHCRRAARDDMRRICTEADIAPVFIYCEATEEELWRRLSQRKGDGPDDLIVTRKELSDYWAGFERPREDEWDIIRADVAGLK